MKLTLNSSSKPEDKWGIRHLMGIMGLLSTALASIQNSCISFAITEMVKHQPRGKKIDTQTCFYVQNTTTIVQFFQTGEFDWDEETQGLILSAFYWGYTVMNVPAGVIVERWGAKLVLGCCTLVGSLGALLSPLVSRALGSWGLICLRVVIGFAQGPIYSALVVMMSNWTSALDRGKSSAIVFSGAYLGNFLAMALSGLIISYLDWTGVFYIFGALGILWLILWWIVYYNTPLEHPFIREDERTYIVATSGKTSYKKELRTPWIPMLTSVPVWGLIIAHIGHYWGLTTVVADLPKYMKSVLHASVGENGIISGLPHLGMWLFSISSGWVSDLMVAKFRWRTSVVRKISITIASVGPAVGIIAASYSGCDKTLATVFFVFGMTIMGTYISGSKANMLDISSNYAGTIMALVGFGGGIAGILTPYLIGVLTPNSTLLEWRLVFWISFSAILGTNIAFLLMGTASTEWWDDPEQVRSWNNGNKRNDEKETSFNEIYE